MNRIEITKYLESLYPRALAYDWDNVGLQIGSLNKPVKKILITLDVTKDVVKEAVQGKFDLLLSHHPLIFQTISNIQFDTPRGWIIKELVKHDIALYSMHTNFDLADGGMNDVLAKKLGLKNPLLLDDEAGIGRYGDVETMSLDAFIMYVKEKLDLDHVRLVGANDKMITSVGISGGSGQQHMYQAKKRGCDIYLTGDITYHNALDALQMGFTLLDIGHNAEKIFMTTIYDLLQNEFPEIEIILSRIDTNPYQMK